MNTFTLKSSSKGFTLIEILIALSISSIVMVAVYQTFNSQQRSYILQEEVAYMQQNLRGAMMLLTNDIRMAGYDSQLTGTVQGIRDITPRIVTDTSGDPPRDKSGNDIQNTGGNPIQFSRIEVAADLDDNGTIGSGETIEYCVYDFVNNDGNMDLARDSGGGRQLLAENITGIGMAFAFDDDLDGELDTYTAANPGATEQIIWAFDSDGDNDLDANIDTDNNGIYDINDSPGGVGSNGIVLGSALASDVIVANIRAVKLWVLAETDRDQTGYNDQSTFLVGPYVITPDTDGNPDNDNKRMRLLSVTIKCRNLGI